MAGVAGKNKIERGFRILVDYSTTPTDITGDLLPGTMQGGGKTLDEIEMTGVSNTTKNYLTGHADSPISGEFYMNDTASTGAYTVLAAALGSVVTVTLQWGSNGAAPSAGDPEWEGEYILTALPCGFNGGKATVKATFKPGTSTAPAMGTVS